VKKLRRKLTAAAPSYRFVHTHYGFGYRLWAELV
jgi:DNA-binding response OmpR family regulator